MSLDLYLEIRCPHCGQNEEFYWANITHNLGKMASAAGIYDVVWRPEENGIEFANQIVEPLRAGIELMEREPERFKAFDSGNGWGTYDDFLPWLKLYLSKCEEFPLAQVRSSR